MNKRWKDSDKNPYNRIPLTDQGIKRAETTYGHIFMFYKIFNHDSIITKCRMKALIVVKGNSIQILLLSMNSLMCG